MWTDFNIFCTAETGKNVQKQGMHLLIYYEDVDELRERLISVCGANWTNLLWTTPSTSGGVVCRPVSTLKVDILNITYDCYSQNNNVKMATLQIW